MLVFGTTTKEKAIGRVAEACSGCGSASTFAVVETSSYFHLFFIPLERLSAPGVKMKCEACGLLLGFDGRKYRSVETRKDVPLAELVAATNPPLASWIEEQSQFQARARAGALVRAERMQVVTDVLTAAEQQLQVLRGKTPVDRRVALSVTAMFTFWLPFVALPSSLAGTAGVFAAVWLVGAVVFLFHSGLTARRRWFERTAVPRLRERLTIVSPSVEEVAGVATQLRAKGYEVGRLVKPELLVTTASSAEATPAAP